MRNAYFVIKDDYIEYYVDGELITDCFSKSDEIIELIEQLHAYAKVPIYKNVDHVLEEEEER